MDDSTIISFDVPVHRGSEVITYQTVHLVIEKDNSFHFNMRNFGPIFVLIIVGSALLLFLIQQSKPGDKVDVLLSKIESLFKKKPKD